MRTLIRLLFGELFKELSKLKEDVMDSFDELKAQVENMTAQLSAAKSAEDRAALLLTTLVGSVQTLTAQVADLTAKLQEANASANQAAVKVIADQIATATAEVAKSTAALVSTENIVDPPAAAPSGSAPSTAPDVPSSDATSAAPEPPAGS